MKAGIYAIRDNIAEELLGGMQALTIHKSPATAVRMFSEILATWKSDGQRIPRTPNEYDLVKLADIDTEEDFPIILSGAAWAAQQPTPEDTK